MLPENTKAYTYAWDKEIPQTLPLGTELEFKVVKTPVAYTLTFITEEGISEKVFTVETLETLTLPTPPGKIGYTTRWDKSLAEIGLENTQLIAVYTPIEYVIHFEGVEGVEDIRFTVETMGEVRLPAVPEKRGYIGKWDKKLSELGLANTTLTALYEAIEYEVRFVGVEGIAPMKYTIETIASITFPNVPKKEGYVGEWSKTPDTLTLENTIVEAWYTAIEYTITFIDGEKSETLTFTVENKAYISFPALTERMGYVASWDKTLEEIALENTIITARYVAIEYSVRFVGLEEEITKTFTIETLFDFRFPNLPNREGYEGSWDKTLSDINLENTIVTAMYTPIIYYARFETGEGLEEISPIAFTVETLEELQLPNVPEKAGYKGAWDKTPLDIRLEDTYVRAVYTPIKYTLIFLDAGEGAKRTFTVETLSNLTFPTPTEKPGYVVAWDKSIADVSLSDMTITAMYTTLEYKVHFNCEGE